MQNPLVSILIPFKNTVSFLNECLDSIVQQQYTNWEVLAVNDHSNDNSTSILSTYALNDPRIKVYDNEGNGIIDALRTAYSHSNGMFITRMDSDDIMLPERLHTMLDSLLAKGPSHLAVGQVQYFSKEGIKSGYKRYEEWLNQLTKEGTNYSEIYKECVIPSPCWMVRREDLDLCGAFLPDRYPEDYDLAFRFYEKGLTCIPCNKILLRWRDYDTRTSRTSEHYAHNYFLEIKLHYFLKLEHNPTKTLTVWGAGRKGKAIAKSLLEKNIDFHWLCDNPKKIGIKIYGKELFHFSALNTLGNTQSIITVANEDAQAFIKNYFTEINQVHRVDYFFFC
ncbi:MAG: glycosyl transferase family 2 [Flavobacteriaceae bacterium]|nr:MAG: glycosyl transferase family 2 [Flavobacteriaceae bacterium]